MATRKERLEEARRLFDLASGQLDDAESAWWEPAEPAKCITNTFYAYENAVTAAMLVAGRDRTRKHYEKAQIARTLFETQILRTDVSDLLTYLNDIRKDVQYGEPGFDMKQVSLEDLVADLERFIEEVKALLEDAEQ
jgi:uncharacterized protein (UPF0332 family)